MRPWGHLDKLMGFHPKETVGIISISVNTQYLRHTDVPLVLFISPPAGTSALNYSDDTAQNFLKWALESSRRNVFSQLSVQFSNSPEIHYTMALVRHKLSCSKNTQFFFFSFPLISQMSWHWIFRGKKNSPWIFQQILMDNCIPPYNYSLQEKYSDCSCSFFLFSPSFLSPFFALLPLLGIISVLHCMRLQGKHRVKYWYLSEWVLACIWPAMLNCLW